MLAWSPGPEDGGIDREAGFSIAQRPLTAHCFGRNDTFGGGSKHLHVEGVNRSSFLAKRVGFFRVAGAGYFRSCCKD